MKSTFLCIQLGLLLLLLVFPMRWIFRGGRFKTAVLMVWGILAFHFAFWMVFGATVAKRFVPPEELQGMADWFPEGPGVVAMVCFGWVNGFIVAGGAWLMRRLAHRFFPSLVHDTPR
jgi:hypothetical protein